MRTEYTIVITNQKGAKSYSTFVSEKYAEELWSRTLDWAARNENRMEFYKNHFIGNSLHDSKLIKANY